MADLKQRSTESTNDASLQLRTTSDDEKVDGESNDDPSNNSFTNPKESGVSVTIDRELEKNLVWKFDKWIMYVRFA
jgi:hypothetical protein